MEIEVHQSPARPDVLPSPGVRVWSWLVQGPSRGAVSLEQVLWFVAAGVSVAVVAGILWTQIRTQASAPVRLPTAP